MKIEHVALNVPDPLEMARWYVEHLGMVVKRRQVDAPWAHFLADSQEQSMLELYKNTDAPIPDYSAMDPAILHIAFVSADIEADCRRLETVGATACGEPLRTPGGDVLMMLRDPWGVAIQLAHRAQSML